MKRFRLSAAQILPVATGFGGCIATDRITVDGCPVGYAYREGPDDNLDYLDSGWRFFAGDEDDAYTSDADKCGIYDVNTIANYSPDIIPFLNTPAPCAFEKNVIDGVWSKVTSWRPPSALSDLDGDGS